MCVQHVVKMLQPIEWVVTCFKHIWSWIDYSSLCLDEWCWDEDRRVSCLYNEDEEEKTYHMTCIDCNFSVTWPAIVLISIRGRSDDHDKAAVTWPSIVLSHDGLLFWSQFEDLVLIITKPPSRDHLLFLSQFEDIVMIMTTLPSRDMPLFRHMAGYCSYLNSRTGFQNVTPTHILWSNSHFFVDGLYVMLP
jgi:hypothetical protein